MSSSPKSGDSGKAEVVVLPAGDFFLELDSGVTDLGFSIGSQGVNADVKCHLNADEECQLNAEAG
jgi:hypothetical protein